MAQTRIVALALGKWQHTLFGSIATWAMLTVLAGVVALQVVFFARHAAQVFAYPYPLDYGEGPLLAQIDLLRTGTTLRHLYGPLDQPPYIVVNYPPMYLLVTMLVATMTGGTLLAGRLVSLVSTLACVVALVVLTNNERPAASDQRRVLLVRLMIVTAFLALPIVREWSVLMRVDMLGVALGLCGLVALRAGFNVQCSTFNIQHSHRRLPTSDLWLLVTGLLLTASLFTKPSLLAAPVAAIMWLLLRDWRRGAVLAGWLALFGGGLFGWLAAGSHFFEHVVVANANIWQADLAARFWRDQLAIHGPLFAAGALAASVTIYRRRGQPEALRNLALPVVYSIVGAISAVGIGKVGAYLNYFLELYLGLIWLAALAFSDHQQPTSNNRRFRPTALFPALTLVLVTVALLRYYPTWSDTDTRLAGLIEGQNPARWVIGRRGVWQDLRRERLILDAFRRTNAALVVEVQTAGAPILTDIPGVAAQAGQVSRLQAFEHSQILQLWDQRTLRVDLANGRVPLAVIDYLGNWLQPEVIDLLKHRYAQAGSRGMFDLYHPVDPGPRVAADLAFANGLNINGYHLEPSAGQLEYHAGELVTVTLDWTVRQAAGDRRQQEIPNVALSLHSADGRLLAESVQPLVYGAVAPDEFSAEGVQHMQPLHLPDALAPGDYLLKVALLDAHGQQETQHSLATLHVAAQTGALLLNGWLNTGQREYVPAPLLAAIAPLGLPLTPAVPFAGVLQQCFERGCLRLRGGVVERAPLGEWLSAGDLGAVGAFDAPQISTDFRAFYEANGGAAGLGPAVTNEFRSGARIVQYTRFARLERPLNGGNTSLGSVGVDILRLPAGTPYRWP